MISYNKLVRDKIPDIIIKNNQKCIIRTLSEEDFTISLKHKLQEEMREYFENPCLEELADIEEVIRALLKLHGKTYSDLEAVRTRKLNSNGGFDKRIYLIGVEGD